MMPVSYGTQYATSHKVVTTATSGGKWYMQVAQRIRGAVSSKQYGFEDLLCPLIAQACIDVCPKNPNNFNVDNVRVIKITGSGAYNSSVVKGIVIKRDTEGTVKGVTDAKVAVFAQGVDTSSTETKVWFGSH